MLIKLFEFHESFSINAFWIKTSQFRKNEPVGKDFRFAGKYYLTSFRKLEVNHIVCDLSTLRFNSGVRFPCNKKKGNKFKRNRSQSTKKKSILSVSDFKTFS